MKVINSDREKIRTLSEACRGFRDAFEVADLENAYLRKKIEQLEKRLEDMEE